MGPKRPSLCAACQRLWSWQRTFSSLIVFTSHELSMSSARSTLLPYYPRTSAGRRQKLPKASDSLQGALMEQGFFLMCIPNWGNTDHFIVTTDWLKSRSYQGLSPPFSFLVWSGLPCQRQSTADKHTLPAPSWLPPPSLHIHNIYGRRFILRNQWNELALTRN